MQITISNAARVIEPSIGPARIHCATCGHIGEPHKIETAAVCRRCGSYLAAKPNDVAPSKLPFAFNWGDGVVVVALAILAYLLPLMAWEALMSP